MTDSIDISGLNDEQKAQLSRIVNLLNRSDQPLNIGKHRDTEP